MNIKKTISLLLAAVSTAGLLLSCSGGDVLTYKYNYDLSQYIELGEYKGIAAEANTLNITDEHIQRQILSTRAYYARQIPVTTRGAQYGDILHVNYVATMDGAEIEGGTQTGYELTLGKGTFLTEAEEALLGARSGDEISVDGTYPDSYEDDPSLAGKTVHYEIDVIKVSELEYPAYTEDFVRAYLGYESIEEYEQSIRASLEANYQATYYEAVIAQVWPVIVENTVVKEYPQKELDAMYNEMVDSYKNYASAQGVVFADYIEAVSGYTEEEFYAYAKATAEERIKEEMISYAIARAENLTLTEEEYIQRATEYATEMYNLSSLETFEKLYDKDVIQQTLLMDKVREFVADNASITYVEGVQVGQPATEETES